MDLKFADDSSFELVDSCGCNRLDYVGHWIFRKADGGPLLLLQGRAKAKYDNAHDAYLVPNNKTGKIESVKTDQYFAVISVDTIIVQNEGELQFRGLTFRAQSVSKDLNLVRAKMVERYYTTKFGKRQFIEAFGGGKGLAQARKTIMECGTIAIPLKAENRIAR